MTHDRYQERQNQIIVKQKRSCLVGGDSVKKGRRAQLDRENAHFILSEAMISTFEQVIFLIIGTTSNIIIIITATSIISTTAIIITIAI